MENDVYFIGKCRELAEQKSNLGESNNWKNQDFEILSDQILEETDIKLSVATLKRIWGKVKYDSEPNITTLNTLAKFVEYENWRVFTKSQPLPGNGAIHNGNEQGKIVVAGSQTEPAQPAKDTSRRKNKRKLIFISAIAVILIFIVAFLVQPANKRTNEKADASKFSFGSKKVITEGVPNSVIFDYDASAASANDTILIQQSWDKRLQQQVPYNQKQVTSIYYYPGFFKAKLIVNHQVVKEHDITINTKGWLTLAERENDIPIYFKQTDALGNGFLGLSKEKIKASNIEMQPDALAIGYYNVGEFGNLATDDFKFETELKNDYNEGSAACQQTEIILLCEENFISIPLSAKGCIANLRLYFLGNQKDGKTEDLSAFGCDFSNWVKLSCQVSNKQCSITINNKVVYEAHLQSEVKKISGIVFRFKGTGSVNYVKLSKVGGNAVYDEEFGGQ